ncbi:MAG: O-antigen ligase domain-containing protein [Lachnospiraceae bacterium]|nr:O-antigen ligase domain-containing protein [Lachnospiraceae bacterium]
MSNRIKKKQETKSSFQETQGLLIGIFVLAVLCLMPVVFTRFYFNILETKYIFYCIISIGAMVLMGGYGLASGRVEAFFKEFRLSAVIKSLNVVDWAMLVFWLCNVLSWVFCTEWYWDAFWGTLGRYNGVFLMTIYMIMYFLVTRFFCFKQWYLDAFLAVGIFVCVFGITDYFQMDILQFKVRMIESQKAIYTSTIGNINTYTVYIGALMVVSMILFTLEKNQKRMLWYYGNMVLAGFALIMGSSDNAYLTLGALFGFSPLWLFRTKTGFRRYWISAASFLTVIQCIAWINVACADSVVGVDGLFSVLAGLRFLPLLVAVLWAIAGAAAALTLRKTEKNSEELGIGAVYAWLAVILLAAAALTFVLYDANAGGHAQRYGALRSYVVFNDDWGTRRGYVWTRALEVYATKFTTLQKVFGYGTDMLWAVMSYYFEPVMENGHRVVYDSVHNEYLHYLVTIGPIGMMAYITLLGSAVVRMCGTMKDRPEVVAAMFAVVAYATQAVVNINLPIATPIILTLLAMGVGKRVWTR